ncbi:hypothetical protein ABT369_38835 [Dactylosporangium sp. NPDC000244]|uniref:hypothetical protein n=1 Tax=Dactylosporangium sp. NPDC000244 TaxID=3154365 RepID=UPI00332B5B2A
MTVTVIAAEVVTAARQIAVCPSTAVPTLRCFQVGDPYDRWVPRLSVTDGAAGSDAVPVFPDHSTTTSEFAGGVKLAVVTVAVVVLVWVTMAGEDASTATGIADQPPKVLR